MPTLRVAACQIDPQLGEVEANLERIARAVADAAAAGAVLAVLPEAAVTGYAFTSLDEGRAVARRAGVVAGEAIAGLAETHRMTVICGTLEAQGDEVFNVALMATPDGRRYTYRKMHLPFLGIDRFATPGPDAPSVVEVNGLRIGVLICYDLRFPEAARMCALDGADLIALPTNWPVGVDFHPGIFAPARAAENHCYLLACDRVGTERGVTFIGRSSLFDFDGHQLAVASDANEELLLGEIDPDAARQTHVRRRPGEHEWDTVADRRPGLYGRLLEPAVDRQHPPSAELYSGDVD
jgi:predicted amidohydrolase